MPPAMNTKLNNPNWNPPHCPNPHCCCHTPQPQNWHFRRIGFFRRQKPPRRVQRFLCLHCRKAFSSQSFRTTYWLKRPELLIWVFKLSVGGMANRQIARALKCAPATVDNMLARLGRHCLLFHRQMIKGASPFSDIVIDGLVSFEHSQYFPFEHLIAVDRNSSFFIHFTDAPLRRSGTMTLYQKKKRQRLEAELGRPDPQAVDKGMREVVELALSGATAAVVRSDKHRAYPGVLRQMDCEIQHLRIDSRVKRDKRNELFEVNCLDMLIRHCGKNHTRETIAFSKRRQGSAERLAVLLVWRNYVKRRWEKGCRETPAMLVGLMKRVLDYGEVLSRRLFPRLVRLPSRWRDYYWRRVRTPVLGVNRKHEWTYAA